MAALQVITELKLLLLVLSLSVKYSLSSVMYSYKNEKAYIVCVVHFSLLDDCE